MCTRVFNNKNLAHPTTARNMDWATPLPTTLFSFKSGLTKYALDHKDEVPANCENWSWTSAYASLVAMVGVEGGYGSSDGINSKGLVANVLYQNQADYKLKDFHGNKYLSVLRLVQYVLDNCQSAKEVYDIFVNKEFELLSADVPGSDPVAKATIHLSVSDTEGYSTIVEVYGGEYHLHYGFDYTIMTNDPNYNIQLRLNDYWLWQWSEQNSFPSRTIPGGPFPADRFERAAYYFNNIDAPTSFQESLAQSKSVVANASVPLGMKGFPGHPNISPTIWTTLADQINLKYYFCNARTPNIIWADLNGLTENDVAKLDLVTVEENPAHNNSPAFVFINHEYEGCVNDLLKKTIDPYGA